MARAATACCDRRMRRLLATAGTVLLLVFPLSGCGGNDAGAKAGAKSSSSAAPTDLPTDLPTGLPSCLGSALPTDLPTNPTEVPSDLAACLPSNLPTDLPTDLPTEVPTDVPTQASGGALDSCAVVTPELIKADFGGASAGQALSQPSSFGDPNAKDCYYVGGDMTMVIQATTRADQDMPATSNSYEGLPGAIQIVGADRGWAYVVSSSSDAVVSGLILVKGQNGLNFSITVQGHPYTVDDLQTFATHVLAGM
jgi:hypothetical protein